MYTFSLNKYNQFLPPKIYNLYKNEGVIHMTISAVYKKHLDDDLNDIFYINNVVNQFLNSVENLQNLYDKDPISIYNITGLSNYINMHKVKDGICFEYDKPSYAVWNYKKIKKSPFFTRLNNAFPDISFSVTFPWRVWTDNIEIYNF